MATKIAERSTYWKLANSSTPNTPYSDGDYRYYWILYYEQTDEDKKPWNNRTKVIVKYYIQTYKSTSSYADVVPYPSGTSTSTVTNGYDSNDSTTKSINTSAGDIVIGDNYKLKYVGEFSKIISHNTIGDGSFVWQGSGFGKGTKASMYTLPHINRYSTFNNIDTFDIDAGFSTTITKYVSSFYDKLEVIVGGEVVRTINDAKGTIEIKFTDSELDKIYSLVPTGETTNFTIKTTTYTDSSMGTAVGSYTQTPIGRFSIVLPTVNGAVCTDKNTALEQYTGDSTMQTIIRGQSLVHVTIPSNMTAIANTRGATIKEYVIEGLHVAHNAAGTSITLVDIDEEGYPINHGKYSQKDNIIIYAVDSRGTSSLPYVQKFTKYINYEPVKVNTKTDEIGRQNNGVSRFIDVSFEGTWWNGNFGAVQNQLIPIVYYRNAEDNDNWTNLDEFVAGAQIGYLDETLIDISTPGVFKYEGPIGSSESDKGFDVEINYDMLIGFWDLITNEVLTVTVPYGKPAIAVYKNKAALGGPYDESLGGTQLWGDIYVNGEPHGSGGSAVDAKRHAISAYLSTPDTRSYTAWTTYRTRFNAYTSVGDKLTFDANNNYIVVGPGVSKVKVSGCAYFCGKKSEDSSNSDYNVTLPATQLRVWCTTYNAEGGAIDSTPAYHHHTNVNTNESVVVTERIFSVEEGWRIDMCTQIGITSTATLVPKGTVLYAEVME